MTTENDVMSLFELPNSSVPTIQTKPDGTINDGDNTITLRKSIGIPEDTSRPQCTSQTSSSDPFTSPGTQDFSAMTCIQAYNKLALRSSGVQLTEKDLQLAKVGKLLLDTKIDVEAAKKCERIIQNGHGEVIGPQLHQLHNLSMENLYQVDTILRLMWRRIQQTAPQALNNPEPKKAPTRHRTASTPQDLVVETKRNDYEDWWEAADVVASPRPVMRPRTDTTQLEHDHCDSDSDAEDETISGDDVEYPDGRVFRRMPSFQQNEDMSTEDESLLHIVEENLKNDACLQCDTRSENTNEITSKMNSARAHANSLSENSGCEGLLYLRVPARIVAKKWRPRYVVFQAGVLRVYESRSHRMHNPRAPVEVITLTKSCGLSSVKTSPAKPGIHPRIMYRHIAQLNTGVTMTSHQEANSNHSGQSRVFKFGCDNSAEFEQWSKVIKECIDRAARKAHRRAQEHQIVSEAHSSSDAFQQALQSPTKKNMRRPSKKQIDSGVPELVYVNITLLDGERHNIAVAQGATVKDALVSLRRTLSLRADADYSLFLREVSGGRETFTVLPDVMSVEEAEGLALAENKSLVYKRRMYVPEQLDQSDRLEAASPSARQTHQRVRNDSSRWTAPDECPSVEEEEKVATHMQDAAHRLAYNEAVHSIINQANYVLNVEDGITFAALHAITKFGQFNAGTHTEQFIQNNLRYLFCAPLLIEAINRKCQYGKQKYAKAVIAVIRQAFKITSELLSTYLNLPDSQDSFTEDSVLTLQFRAQRLFLRKAKTFSEYGSAFFHAGFLKQQLTVKSGTASESQAIEKKFEARWSLEATTTEHAADTEMERVPVVVAINSHGILLRPLPPVYTPTEDFLKYQGEGPSFIQGNDSASNAKALRMMQDLKCGSIIPWVQHRVQDIEVWGVKRMRPVFTYRVCNKVFAGLVELQSPQYKEMSAFLHSYVFALLAAKENQPRPHARPEKSDYGLAARAAKSAMQAAKAQAQQDLPQGWSEIRDPVTGSTVYWNQFTKRIVWAKPSA